LFARKSARSWEAFVSSLSKSSCLEVMWLITYPSYDLQVVGHPIGETSALMYHQYFTELLSAYSDRTAVCTDGWDHQWYCPPFGLATHWARTPLGPAPPWENPGDFPPILSPALATPEPLQHRLHFSCILPPPPSLPGLGCHLASTITGQTTPDCHPEAGSTKDLDHLWVLHTMRTPPALAAPKALPHGLLLLFLAHRDWTPLCFHHPCCNIVNCGHCWITLLQQWPRITLQQWPCIPLLHLYSPWLPLWRHHLWCGV
jgi:hypothetical protein